MVMTRRGKSVAAFVAADDLKQLERLRPCLREIAQDRAEVRPTHERGRGRGNVQGRFQIASQGDSP